jgi:cell division protein FtsQ
MARKEANALARNTRNSLPPLGRNTRNSVATANRNTRNTLSGASRNTRSSLPPSSRNTRSTLSGASRGSVTRTSRSSVSTLGENRRKPRVTPSLTLSQRYGLLRLWLWQRLTSFKSLGALLLRALLAAAVLAGVVSVFRLAERYARTSSSFAIVRIDVHGHQHLTSEAVMRAAGIALGQNVFDVAPEEVRKRLSQEPWIESVQVRRRLPGSYTIELRERRAVALLALEELFLVSDDGLAFKPLTADDPYDLPVITGLDPAQLKPDERTSSSALMSAVALLHDYQDAGLGKRDAISEIHVESDGGLGLYVGADATQVRLGKPPFREKLDRLREIMSLLKGQKTRAAYVLLENQRRLDRVTVRLR